MNSHPVGIALQPVVTVDASGAERAPAEPPTPTLPTVRQQSARASALAVAQTSGRAVLTQVGVSLAGLGTIATLLGAGQLGAATVAGVIAGAAATGVAASTVVRWLRSPGSSRGDVGVSSLSEAQRARLVQAIEKLTRSGIGFVSVRETSSRMGSAPLPAVVVLGALASAGELYVGTVGHCSGRSCVWSNDAYQVRSVQDICNFAGINLDELLS